jgi:hypothetical protein
LEIETIKVYATKWVTFVEWMFFVRLQEIDWLRLNEFYVIIQTLLNSIRGVIFSTFSDPPKISLDFLRFNFTVISCSGILIEFTITPLINWNCRNHKLKIVENFNWFRVLESLQIFKLLVFTVNWGILEHLRILIGILGWFVLIESFFYEDTKCCH